MLIPLLCAIAFAPIDWVLANVTVTGATRGGSISADTAANAESPEWTSLGAITIAEGANNDFGSGNGVTLILKAPNGFEFNTAVNPNITFTPGRNISSASVAVNNSTTITVTLQVSNLLPLPAADTLTIGSTTGIQVRPVSGSPLARGRHIYRPNGGGGSASIAGITTSSNGSAGSNFGDLTETTGAAILVRVETLANGNGTVMPAQNITAGSSINGYSIIRDSFSNFITNGAADSWFLTSKTGGVLDGDLVPAGNLKSAVFTGHLTGMATIGVALGALTQDDSGTLTVVAGPASRLFVTLPDQIFTAGNGNSGEAVSQTAGIPFTISKLTAVDNFTNIAATYSGTKAVKYSGPAGNPIYTTNVGFTAGLSTTTLETTLAQPETTTITASISGLTGIPSSTVIIKPFNTPPTIAPIASQTIFVDHPALYKFYIRDLESATNNLQLSFASSNLELFPIANAVFHYFLFDPDGPHWYLTLVPAFGQTGTATNTLIVSDGTNSSSADFVVTVSPPSPGAARFANTNAMTIPDAGPASLYPSTVNITGMSGTITNVTLTVNQFTHNYPGDVHMLLASPTGQGVVIWSRCGAQYAVNNVTATLHDSAPFPLPGPFEIWSEQYRPTNLGLTNFFPAPAPGEPYVTDFAAFNGLTANGTWSLYVDDMEAPDSGSIAGGWSLMVATTGGEDQSPLRILSLTGGGTTNVVITWSSVSNVTYRVEYQANLDPANWFNLSPDVTATDITASANDNTGDTRQRFYRVRTVP